MGKRIPNSYMETDREVISNFDHLVDKTIEQQLKTGKYYSQYAGWNFCGYVWWDRNECWLCEVWQYHNYIETVEGKTLEEIMEKVSDKYGWE